MIKRLVKRLLPAAVADRLGRSNRTSSIVRRVPYENVYFCCTWKTASQWLHLIFLDPLVFRYSGLEVFPFEPWLEGFARRAFPQSTPRWEVETRLYQGCRMEIVLPQRMIASTLYVGYETYASIPKPPRYRSFFVLRDPRDVVVSAYFSILKSHSLNPNVERLRPELERRSQADGLHYTVDLLDQLGLFAAQRSWCEHVASDPCVQIFRYEDLAEDDRLFLSRLFDWLGIMIPAREFDALCERHAFGRHANGREPGQENASSHYRKGVAGDWRNYFDENLKTQFMSVTGALVQKLGYEP